jgi:hypothetical protein
MTPLLDLSKFLVRIKLGTGMSQLLSKALGSSLVTAGSLIFLTGFGEPVAAYRRGKAG